MLFPSRIIHQVPTDAQVQPATILLGGCVEQRQAFLTLVTPMIRAMEHVVVQRYLGVMQPFLVTLAAFVPRLVVDAVTLVTIGEIYM